MEIYGILFNVPEFISGEYVPDAFASLIRVADS